MPFFKQVQETVHLDVLCDWDFFLHLNDLCHWDFLFHFYNFLCETDKAELRKISLSQCTNHVQALWIETTHTNNFVDVDWLLHDLFHDFFHDFVDVDWPVHNLLPDLHRWLGGGICNHWRKRLKSLHGRMINLYGLRRHVDDWSLLSITRSREGEWTGFLALYC